MCILIETEITPKKPVYRQFDEVLFKIRIKNTCGKQIPLKAIENVLPSGFFAYKISPRKFQENYNPDKNILKIKKDLTTLESTEIEFFAIAAQESKDKFEPIVKADKKYKVEGVPITVTPPYVVTQEPYAISGDITIDEYGQPGSTVNLTLSLKNNMPDTVKRIILFDVLPKDIVDEVYFELAKIEGVRINDTSIILFKDFEPGIPLKITLPLKIKDFKMLGKVIPDITKTTSIKREIDPKVLCKYGEVVVKNPETVTFFGNKVINIDLRPKIHVEFRVNTKLLMGVKDIVVNKKAELEVIVSKVGGTLSDVVIEDVIPTEFEVPTKPANAFIEKSEEGIYVLKIPKITGDQKKIKFKFIPPKKIGTYKMSPTIKIPQLGLSIPLGTYTLRVIEEKAYFMSGVEYGRVMPVRIGAPVDIFIKIRNSGDIFAENVTLVKVPEELLEITMIKEIFPEVKTLKIPSEEKPQMLVKKLKPRGEIHLTISAKPKVPIDESNPPYIEVKWKDKNEEQTQTIYLRGLVVKEE
ncbi:MAG: hypothetical protein ACP6IS_01225 [Candidatus Asgardarchaeia archaeon]